MFLRGRCFFCTEKKCEADAIALSECSACPAVKRNCGAWWSRNSLSEELCSMETKEQPFREGGSWRERFCKNERGCLRSQDTPFMYSLLTGHCPSLSGRCVKAGQESQDVWSLLVPAPHLPVPSRLSRAYRWRVLGHLPIITHHHLPPNRRSLQEIGSVNPAETGILAPTLLLLTLRWTAPFSFHPSWCSDHKV